jgi:hypothetical protein
MTSRKWCELINERSMSNLLEFDHIITMCNKSEFFDLKLLRLDDGNHRISEFSVLINQLEPRDFGTPGSQDCPHEATQQTEVCTGVTWHLLCSMWNTDSNRIGLTYIACTCAICKSYCISYKGHTQRIIHVAHVAFLMCLSQVIINMNGVWLLHTRVELPQPTSLPLNPKDRARLTYL